MIRKRLVFTALVLTAGMLLAAGLSACGLRRYRIIHDTSFIDSCPDSAAAGETVEFTVLCVTDGYLVANVSGVSDLEWVDESHVRFVMPAQDVEIRVTMIADEFGA